MARITPYTLNDIVNPVVTDVEWNLVSVFTPTVTVKAAMTIADLDYQHGEFVSSVIFCRHPDGGKFWESMFIPLTSTGGAGVSITRWGKEATRGQSQAKMVSEQEWYKTVKSKVMAGGYETLNFVGRETPLSSDHHFVKVLHSSPDVPTLPGFAFSPAQKLTIGRVTGAEGLGYVMGKALWNIIPTERFLLNMATSGHDVAQALKMTVKSSSVEQMDVIDGFVRGISESGDSAVVRVSKNGTVLPPEPVIDREEVYGGGWGAFG